MGCGGSICGGDVEVKRYEKALKKRSQYYVHSEQDGNVLKNTQCTLRRNKAGDLLQINNFRVKKFLGKGAFGDVYLCTDIYADDLYDESIPEEVAVKVLSRKEAKSVQKEIGILTKLDHPHVVQLFEYIDDENHPFIFLVFEALSGGPLCHFTPEGMLKGDPWSESTARKYFEQIVNGLEYLHSMRIIHRDIKPENIAFDADRENVKLIDFGESRLLKTCDDSSRKTAGTPMFHSPEAADGTGELFSGVASDVWALGVTLYLVLFGEIPFGKGVSNHLVMWNSITNDPLQFPKSSLSDAVLELLCRMLEKDPTQRITLPEIKDHRWLTGFTVAPRLRAAVTMTPVDVFEDENMFEDRQSSQSTSLSPGGSSAGASSERSTPRHSFRHQLMLTHPLPRSETKSSMLSGTGSCFLGSVSSIDSPRGEIVSTVAPLVVSNSEPQKKSSFSYKREGLADRRGVRWSPDGNNLQIDIESVQSGSPNSASSRTGKARVSGEKSSRSGLSLTQRAPDDTRRREFSPPIRARLVPSPSLPDTRRLFQTAGSDNNSPSSRNQSDGPPTPSSRSRLDQTGAPYLGSTGSMRFRPSVERPCFRKSPSWDTPGASHSTLRGRPHMTASSSSTTLISVTTSRRSERSHILPKTPKLQRAASIPALEMSQSKLEEGNTETPPEENEQLTQTRCDSADSSRSEERRTPVAEILNIVSQDARARIRLLIVEDVFQQRNIMTKLCKEIIRPQYGVTCDIDVAEDGDEAIRAVTEQSAKDEPYTAVLMDVHMPRVSGIDAARQIRFTEQQEGWLEVPIFAITADTDEDAMQELCREAGMQKVFFKPLTPDMIRSILEWLNIPFKRNINESEIFQQKHAYHNLYKKNMERRKKDSENGKNHDNINWWYTVDIEDSMVDMGSRKASTTANHEPPSAVVERMPSNGALARNLDGVRMIEKVEEEVKTPMSKCHLSPGDLSTSPPLLPACSPPIHLQEEASKLSTASPHSLPAIE
eukprot:Sspe_Gene.55056::Locus_30322_Transcript_1_1_Confidence_1.000_Length_3236::g.55056::m.55056